LGAIPDADSGSLFVRIGDASRDGADGRLGGERGARDCEGFEGAAMSADQPLSRFLHLYAIVRFDFPLHSQNPTNNIPVVKVFSSQEAADQEASRLNHINADKSCKYEVQITRFIA
jgi:hypothetical protein